MGFGFGDKHEDEETRYSSSQGKVSGGKEDSGTSLQERIAGAAASFALKKFEDGVEEQKDRVSIIEKLAGLAVSEVEKLAVPESMSHDENECAKEAARKRTQHMYESKYPHGLAISGQDSPRKQSSYSTMPTTYNSSSAAGAGGYADVKGEEAKQSAYGGIVSNYMKTGATPAAAATGGGYNKVDNTEGQGDFWRTDNQESRPHDGRSGGINDGRRSDQDYNGRKSNQGVYGSTGGQGYGNNDQGYGSGRTSDQTYGEGRSGGGHSYGSGGRSDLQGYDGDGGRSDQGYGSSGGRVGSGYGDTGGYEGARRRSNDEGYGADTSRY